jgi:hypothetical protein
MPNQYQNDRNGKDKHGMRTDLRSDAVVESRPDFQWERGIAASQEESDGRVARTLAPEEGLASANYWESAS